MEVGEDGIEVGEPNRWSVVRDGRLIGRLSLEGLASAEFEITCFNSPGGVVFDLDAVEKLDRLKTISENHTAKILCRGHVVDKM